MCVCARARLGLREFNKVYRVETMATMNDVARDPDPGTGATVGAEGAVTSLASQP
jgi:hypothetical protein